MKKIKDSNLAVFVGLSTNGEVITLFDASPEDEKVPGISFKIEFSGSSANVAIAIQKFGYRVSLVGLVGVDRTDGDLLLEASLTKTSLTFTRIPVLTKSNLASIVANQNPSVSVKSQVVGFRGKVIPSKVRKAVSKIKQVVNSEQGWRLATGITSEQFMLAQALLGDNVGYRSLSPHRSFCDNVMERENLIHLLKQTDLFILNQKEFDDLKMPTSEIHAKGVSLIVVTNGKKGGFYSFYSNGILTEKTFSALSVEGVTYETGAGDWFHAMLISYFKRKNISVKTLSVELLDRAIFFATRVVAKKILYPGGSNGPSPEDMRQM